MTEGRNWFIRNVAEVPWRQFPDHFGGALSKPLVIQFQLRPNPLAH